MTFHLPLAFVLASILLSSCSYAADATIEPLEFNKYRAGDLKIEIDGRLDEPIWQAQQTHDNMVLIEPDTLTPGKYRTQTRFFYTAKGLYLGVKNEQPPSTLVARLSSRDAFVNRDGISLTVDPSGEGLYGYWFGVNLGDTQSDGTVLPERQFSNQWDGAWRGASAILEDGWSAEMFLPWSMMSMPEADQQRLMGFYISRKVAHLNERWAWPALPPTQTAFLSALQPFKLADINPRQQLIFYPFASSTYDNIESETSYKAGFDLFWRPSSNVQLSTTINPDFGAIESDDVVINLTAYETFFPEKRAFFLEGNEIFVTTPRAQVGGPNGNRQEPTTLVNTRRIGGQPREPVVPEGVEFSDLELSQPTELVGAVKITGQSRSFRYGILAAVEDDTNMDAMLDDADYRYKQTGRDFGVARVLYEDVSDGGRRSIGWISTIVAHEEADAIVHGIDTHLLSANKSWLWDVQLFHSEVDGQQGVGGFTDIKYNQGRGKEHKFSFDWLDEKVDINDLGYIRRNDFINAQYQFNLTESDIKGLRERQTRVKLTRGYNNSGDLVSGGILLNRSWTFQNNSMLFTDLGYLPEQWDDINSEDNGIFRIEDRLQASVFWESDSAKSVSYGLGAGARQESLGDWTYDASTFISWRPSDRFAVELSVDYQDRDGWLIYLVDREFATFSATDWQPRLTMDFFLTSRQQLRITSQWAGIKAREQAYYQVPLNKGPLQEISRDEGDNPADFSISRLTFQFRYRWEIAPLSDLFVVYTRGSSVDSMPEESFRQLLKNAWTDSIIDVFTVKLRYRLGG